MNNATKDIALALSGDGSRITLPPRLSGSELVSGGSVIAAAYCLNKVGFQALEERITVYLKQGLFWLTLKKHSPFWACFVSNDI